MRIICIGNRFAYPDNFGILIYEELKKMDLKGVEVVEGGVGGLSLMPYFEDDKEILIVDYSIGYDKRVLTKKDIDEIEIKEFNHANAFLYLLKSVDKEFRIYTISEEFDENDLSEYIKEILELVDGSYKRDVN